MNPPDKIEIRSDGNILKYEGKSKDGKYNYRYSKSVTKLGLVLSMDEENLQKLINTQNIFKK